MAPPILRMQQGREIRSPEDLEKELGRMERLAVIDHFSYFKEVTGFFHDSFVHVRKDDVARSTVENRLLHFGMQVPAWENYILFLMAYTGLHTYRDYEFCDYRRALERGTGRCGQQSLSMVAYLGEFGFDTGFGHMNGHTVATARIGDGKWHVLDPDYGVVIPHSLEELSSNCELARPFYAAKYGPDGFPFDKVYCNRPIKVAKGGADIRWRKACPFERVAYWIKWLLPLMLMLPAVAMFGRRVSRPG